MMNVTERLASLGDVRLDHGSHGSFEEGHCAMELVSYLAGEPHSDHPKCACPVLTAFVMSWNDSLPDKDRTRLLLPFLPRLIGTRDKTKEERRALMAADWFVRVHTPAWLRLAGLTVQADALSSLPEITEMSQVPSMRAPLEAVRRDAAAAWDAARAAAGDAAGAAARAAAGAAARAAAWDAAWDAAGDAAWDAARAAAWDAAWDAARAAARAAAWDAARAAAGAAAGAAARAAARAAAGDALTPTVRDLQASALQLLDRMIEA